VATAPLKHASGGGLDFTEVSGPVYEGKMSAANTTAVATISTSDVVFVSVGGVVKTITLANFNNLATYVKSYILTWPGIPEVTDADNVELTQKKITGVAGRKNTIIAMGVVGCSGLYNWPRTSAVTGISAGAQHWNAEGSAVSIDIPDEKGTLDLVTVAKVLTESPLVAYVWIDDNSGKHSDLQVQIDIEVSD